MLWGVCSHDLSTRATRGLRSGHLTALAALANGGPTPNNGSAERLRQRQFIRVDEKGRASLTLRGHFALMIRRSMD